MLLSRAIVGPMVGVVAVLAIGFAIVSHRDLAERVEPPRIGENVESVIDRLGTPHFDSRTSGDPEADYRLGYTLNLGTRYHLQVQNGIITDISYSSR